MEQKLAISIADEYKFEVRVRITWTAERDRLIVCDGVCSSFERVSVCVVPSDDT